MRELTIWLNSLPLSVAIRRAHWSIPLLQTIHILTIGMVLSSVIMIALRIWGAAGGPTLAERTRRFMPWLWAGIALSTVTGVVLLIGEPRRSLNGAFQVKMAIMAVALIVTIAFEVALRRHKIAWDGMPGPRARAGFYIASTLLLWVAVTIAGRGRWIANFLPI
jgi:hypothetical protein